MSEAFRIVQATAKKHLKGAIDLTIRKRQFFRNLEERGRIILDADGYDLNWDYEYREATISPYGAGGVLSFAPNERYRQLTTDVRGYKGTDVLHEKDALMNTGDVAIIKYYDKIVPSLIRDMRNMFCGEFWIDGDLAANANRLHGIESFMGTGTTAASDIIAQPSTTETYAGRPTGLSAAGHGGSWSSDLTTSPNATVATDWPFGSGDVSYDCLTPKVANYTSSGWGTGGTTWEANCERALRHMKNWCCLTGGEEGIPDVHMLSGDLFTGFQNHFEAERRTINPHTAQTELGFPSTLNFEGAGVAMDYDVPAGVGYPINFDQVDLFSIDSVLFRSRGPTWDERTAEYLYSIGYYGNLRWNTKFFGAFKAVA